jgi:hypothetical protein
MVIDIEPNLSLLPAGNSEDLPRKGKFREGKKVCPCSPHSAVNNCHDTSSQVAEKRPEVRFLEVSEIPGIIISPRFQRYMSGKRIKTDHLNGPSQEVRSSKCLRSSILSS